MNQLKAIREGAIDSETSLPSLLRRCLILASKLDHPEFSEWVDHELNGYPKTSLVPAYRRVRAHSIGHFSGPFGSGMRNAPVPLLNFPDEIKNLVKEQTFTESCAALENTAGDVADEPLKGPWGPDVVAFAARYPIYEGQELLDAWRVVSRGTILGILDTVRTRVLQFVLALEKELPTSEDLDTDHRAPIGQAQVTNIFNTTITKGQANIGTTGNANVTVASAAVLNEETHAELKRLIGVLQAEDVRHGDKGDAEERSYALTKVSTELAKIEPEPPRIEKYLAIYATLITVASPTYEAFMKLLGPFL